ncbi:hypothetical protein ACFTIK_18555, partial [Tistrella mobilis]|uniref:hypothetical protein n=1 Tax=Tistrella mobilis TaxID=171437 RepID=UPI0036281987
WIFEEFGISIDETTVGRELKGARPAEWCNSVCLGMMSQGAERPEASSPGAPEIGVVIVDLR